MKITLTGDQARLCPELAWDRHVRATGLPGALMTAKCERVLELELRLCPDELAAELWALVPKVFEGERQPVRLVRATMGYEFWRSLRDPEAKGQLARELIGFAEASRNPEPTGIESPAWPVK